MNSGNKNKSDIALGTSLEDNFEQLLAHNRTPKVSELRTALLAADAREGQAAAEARSFVRGRVAGTSQSLMAFCDLERLYRGQTPCCEVRELKPEDKDEAGGGLLTGAGLYAVRAIQPGEVVSEFDVQGICSSLNTDEDKSVYYDPRIVDKDTILQYPDLFTQDKMAAEALSVTFQDAKLYFFPLALKTCPFKLWHFANDTAVCPDPESEQYTAEDLAKYRDSATKANVAGDCRLGFAARLVSTRHIAKDEQILYHWGSSHWAEMRSLQKKGLLLALRQAPSADDDDDDENSNTDDRTAS